MTFSKKTTPITAYAMFAGFCDRTLYGLLEKGCAVSRASAPETKIFGNVPKPGPVVVGIDQSYTGFAMTVMATDGLSYRTKVYRAPHSGIDRLWAIYSWIVEEFSDIERAGLEVVDVAVESPVRMSHSALISGELWAVVRMACHSALDSAGQYPLQVAPTMLKKYITGKGTGVAKNQILLYVYKKWGVEFTDDNAADSYGLANIAARIGDKTYEQEVLRKLLDDKYRDPRA